MNLEAILRHYQLHHRPRHDHELTWFRTQPSLEDALRVTGKAQDDEGKRYRHQRRIKPQAVTEATNRLFDLHDDLRRCSTFHTLWALIRDNLKPIRGIGDLYIYDASLRIGAYLRLTPERVYLHAGTRIGARKSGLLLRVGGRREWLELNELPAPLRDLPPSDVENLLCITRDGYPTSGTRVTSEGYTRARRHSMPTEIEGMKFTGFARLDMENLVKLDYPGRVKWLKYRFGLIFLTPFRKFVELDGADCYVWLCVVSLLCTAVEALADFEFDGSGMQRFSRFVEI
jgi:hypothetical protein